MTDTRPTTNIIDPITAEVIHSAMETVCFEMATYVRVHLAGRGHDAPVYDGIALAPGPTISGPALIAYPFTTVTLCPGDSAFALTNGDVLVQVPVGTS